MIPNSFWFPFKLISIMFIEMVFIAWYGTTWAFVHPSWAIGSITIGSLFVTVTAIILVTARAFGDV